MTIGKRYAAALEASCGALASAYHYETVLPLLWSEDPDTALGLADRPADVSIVLVTDWTQAAEGDARLLEKHLTPLDWALSYSLKKARAGEPVRPIVIFDLTAGRWTATWAWRMRHQLLADMPWVQLVAPIPPSIGRTAHRWAIDVRSVKGKSALKQISSGAWTLDLTDIKLPGSSESETATLTELHRLWIASLNLTDEQHDINNVVGARLLLGGTASTSDQPLIQALLRRLAWCQPIEIALAGQWGEWPGVAKISEKLFNNPLAVVVIDDKIDHGWDRVLGRLFGVDADYAAKKSDGRSLVLFGQRRTAPSIFLCGSHLADPLIDLLSEAKFDCRDFAMQVSPVGEAIPEIIFLDLRLFARPNEKAAAKRLLEILARDEVKDEAKLAWRTIEQDELDAIKAWAEDETCHDDRIAMDALLLLPRLLAQAMPLTPIILFSSTGQARVRDKLKFYGNIYTGFEKPRSFGNPASAADALSALTTALERAVPMLRLRLQLAHAQKAIQVAVTERPKILTENGHYEIFVEESLRLVDGIVSGALLLEFPNIDSANILQRNLLVQFRDSLVCWTQNGVKSPPKLQKWSTLKNLGDENERAVQVGLLADFLNAAGIAKAMRQNWTSLTTATQKTDQNKTGTGGHGIDRFPDRRLEAAIVDNVCFYLFSYIPYISSKVASVGIYLPTRVVEYEKKELAIELAESYGLLYFKDGDVYKVQSYGKDAGFPLLRNELQSWGSNAAPTRQKITSLKSQILSPKPPLEYPKVQAVRLIHELADWACAGGRATADTEDNQPLQSFRKEIAAHGVINRWFVSQQYQNAPDDLKSFHALVGVNRSAYRTGGGSPADNPIVQLVGVPYVKRCEPRLVQNDPYLTQHQIVLWSMREAIFGATGQMLHAAVEAPNVQ